VFPYFQLETDSETGDTVPPLSIQRDKASDQEEHRETERSTADATETDGHFQEVHNHGAHVHEGERTPERQNLRCQRSHYYHLFNRRYGNG
jgi:hypothetical protein